MDLRGFKAEDIKVQLRGHEITVTGKHKSEDQGFYFSRDYSHRVLLPDDADLGSVTSRLSKEGLLIIEASRDPALLPKERNLDVFVELDEQSPEDEAKQEGSGDTEEENQTKRSMLAGCKTYLIFSKTVLTFSILLIKFLRQKT